MTWGGTKFFFSEIVKKLKLNFRRNFEILKKKVPVLFKIQKKYKKKLYLYS
jgi:hypothetical protein